MTISRVFMQGQDKAGANVGSRRPTILILPEDQDDETFLKNLAHLSRTKGVTFMQAAPVAGNKRRFLICPSIAESERPAQIDIISDED